MTLRRRKYLKGDKEALIQNAAQLMKKNLGFFRQFKYGDAELEGKPNFSLDKARKDLLIEFPIAYETRKQMRDDWIEGPDMSGNFVVYIYPSSDTNLELEMGYQDEHGDEMKSDKGKKNVRGSIRVSTKILNWNLLKRELVKLKKELGGMKAVWI